MRAVFRMLSGDSQVLFDHGGLLQRKVPWKGKSSRPLGMLRKVQTKLEPWRIPTGKKTSEAVDELKALIEAYPPGQQGTWAWVRRDSRNYSAFPLQRKGQASC